MHLRRGFRPASSRPTRGTHHQLAGLSPEFYLFRQLGLFQEGLGNPDATRIADSHDSGCGGHGDYIVITSRRLGNPIGRQAHCGSSLAAVGCNASLGRSHRLKMAQPVHMAELATGPTFNQIATAVMTMMMATVRAKKRGGRTSAGSRSVRQWAGVDNPGGRR